MDEAILLLVVYLMKKTLNVRRITAGALCAATSTTVLLIMQIPYGILYIVSVFCTSLLAMKICMKEKKMQYCILGTVYFYTLAFAITKIFQIGVIVFDNHSAGIIIFALVFALLIVACGVGYVMYLKKKTEKIKTYCYKVQILEGEETVEMTALLDTGNTLREPFSGKPVSVVEKEKVEKIWLNRTQEKYRIIPFHSIGEEHGVMEGMEVEKLTVWKDNEKLVLSKAIIAFYDGKLSKDDRFQMILQQGLL